MREGLEHRKMLKTQDTDYRENPQICPGGSKGNYYTARSGNDFHEKFKISTSGSCSTITFKELPPLPSNSLLSLNSLPHFHHKNSLKLQLVTTHPCSLTSGEKTLSLNKPHNSLLGSMHTSGSFRKILTHLILTKNSIRCCYFYSLDERTEALGDFQSTSPITHGQAGAYKKLCGSQLSCSTIQQCMPTGGHLLRVP